MLRKPSSNGLVAGGKPKFKVPKLSAQNVVGNRSTPMMRRKGH